MQVIAIGTKREFSFVANQRVELIDILKMLKTVDIDEIWEYVVFVFRHSPPIVLRKGCDYNA